MAIQTPSHRLILVLVDDLHLINPTVTSNARDASIDVGRVVEINIVRESVNTNPIDRFAGSPAFSQWLKLGGIRMDRRPLGSPRSTVGIQRFGAVAVDAGLRRRNLRVSGLIHRNVAVLAVHFQLACVQRMAKRNRLQRPIAGVERLGTSGSQEQNARIGTARKD